MPRIPSTISSATWRTCRRTAAAARCAASLPPPSATTSRPSPSTAFSRPWPWRPWATLARTWRPPLPPPSGRWPLRCRGARTGTYCCGCFARREGRAGPAGVATSRGQRRCTSALPPQYWRTSTSGTKTQRTPWRRRRARRGRPTSWRASCTPSWSPRCAWTCSRCWRPSPWWRTTRAKAVPCAPPPPPPSSPSCASSPRATLTRTSDACWAKLPTA
mmetsp:Transcript_4789/g.11949  ORF Transcript_4789/g.11949 Transcript_4789/m.11949 type:complete len:217 (-) Transcript_4789:2209-2859(-)